MRGSKFFLGERARWLRVVAATSGALDYTQFDSRDPVQLQREQWVLRATEARSLVEFATMRINVLGARMASRGWASSQSWRDSNEKTEEVLTTLVGAVRSQLFPHLPEEQIEKTQEKSMEEAFKARFGDPGSKEYAALVAEQQKQFELLRAQQGDPRQLEIVQDRRKKQGSMWKPW